MGSISIKINIADRIYPLRIKTEEEEAIRHAAKLINEKIKELQDNYAVRDQQDLLSMCVLQHAVRMIQSERAVEVGQSELQESVRELASLLAEFFEKMDRF